MDLVFNPIADIFPLLDGEAFERFVEDIRINGLHEAICLHPSDRSIIDGRNRYRACQQAGVEPRFQTWNGEGSLVSFVLSMNLHRRHLNETRRGLLAGQIEPLLAEEAKRRQIATRARPGQQIGKVSALWRPPEKGKSTYFASKAVGVSARTVERAKKLAEEAKQDPKAKHLLAEAEAGTTTLTQALRTLQKDEVIEAAKLPTDKYRVIYADPPWKYGDQLTEDYGPTRFHYPTMTLAELSALPVADLAERNAVLFLWVTSPLPESAFPVIKAWGFAYKTSFVWDKVRHNMGHYNSVRHEFLLVAVRGSCTPDVPKLYDSVVTVERTTHSTKPSEFRNIIDTLYPHGKRLELFARGKVQGWQTWGNLSDWADKRA